MRVLVTGAYGLIGSAILARLHRDGHDLVASGRSIEDAARRLPYARWVEADFNRLTAADDWLPLLAGCDAVVNCVGVLEQGGRDDVRRTHVDGTVALFDACARAGVRRIVHISAIGASAQGKTDFARTKAEADAHLATLDLDWMILRPALVLASTAYGGTAMLRAMAAFPAFVPGMTRAGEIQVVDIDDVTETVALCLRPGAPSRAIWEIAHPQTHTFGEIVAAIRSWLGFAPRPIVNVPYGLAVLIAAWPVSLAGLFGWRSPARVTAFLQLGAGVVGDPAPWSRATGITPRGLADILAARPSGVQERWFARLYMLKPVAILGLAAFWIGTGLVAMGPGRASAQAQLAASGFPVGAVELTVLLGAGFDVVMGTMLLFRRFARRVLILMLVATPLYLAIGTYLGPQLWTDPLGPLLKIVPMLVATMLTLAIVDDR